MATNFDFDILNEEINKAPEAGYGPNVTFGKCVIDIQVLKWVAGEEKGKRKAEKKAYNGKPLAEGEYFQIEFAIDMSEFNSALDFTKKWWVDIKKSNKTGAKPTLTDWSETVEPSLIKAIGKDWTKKMSKGVYVEVEDLVTVAEKKTRMGKDKSGEDKEFPVTAPRFVRVFKSAAECGAAREERFAKKDNGEALTVEEGDIPADVLNDVRGLLKTVDMKQVKTILEAKPFGDYDVDELITAAQAK